MPQLARSSTLVLLAAALFFAPAVQGQIPTPESVLGHPVGADFHLATYEDSIRYLEKLAAASDRVEIRTVGRTSFGRDIHLLVISSPENLARLDRWREISLRLAHPEGLTDDEARKLAREGKAIVHIDNGLHATEVAHAQHAIQLAHDLAAETEDPEILEILDEVVLLLWPALNPDGQTIVAEWYRENLGTPYEVAPLPRLYQKYVGHDNNRDGYMLNVVESRVSTRAIRSWEPQILYNHHQTAPFPARIWIPPFAEPISEHVHPLMWRTVNLIGMAMAQALEERGQEGAMHMGTGFDNWYPGFMDHANNFHNVASFLTETGLYRYATPKFYTVQDFPEDKRDLRPQSLYASPWEGGWWRIGDAVDYMLTASISVLDVAAKYKTDILYNRYQAGRDVIAYHRAQPPTAYFILREQRDPVAAVEMLRRLAWNDIEIHRTTEEITFEGQTYPTGTWVIPMDQPFANFVRQLFAVQSYPDLREYPEGPPDQPYDVAGWTLPMQMDVRTIAATAPLTDAMRAALEPVRGDTVAWDADVTDASPFDSVLGVGFDSHPVAAGIVPKAGRIEGSGPALVLDPAENNTFRALDRAWSAGAKIAFEAGRPGFDGRGGTGGRYVVTDLPDDTAALMVTELALQAERGEADGRRIERPRVGLYRPWSPSMDEGWTRWLLERFGIAFENLKNAEIVAGHLEKRFDVILIPDIDTEHILEGDEKGTVPPRYAGGIGTEGLRALDRFVRGGGTLVTWNRGAGFALEAFHLPVENVAEDLERTDFYLGGSLVEMIVDPSHPVMSGMPERATVFVDRATPILSPTDEFRGSVLAKYPPTGSPLLSGYLLGEKYLNGQASALEVFHGDGRILLLGMRPQWRAQPFGTFRIVLSAALYGAELAGTTPPNDEFWRPPAGDDTDGTYDMDDADGREPGF